jgi:hypothetical protein
MRVFSQVLLNLERVGSTVVRWLNAGDERGNPPGLSVFPVRTSRIGVARDWECDLRSQPRVADWCACLPVA